MFDVCRNSFATTSHENWQPNVSLQEALSQQNRQVDLYRQQDTAAEDVLSEEAVPAGSESLVTWGLSSF